MYNLSELIYKKQDFNEESIKLNLESISKYLNDMISEEINVDVNLPTLIKHIEYLMSCCKALIPNIDLINFPQMSELDKIRYDDIVTMSNQLIAYAEYIIQCAKDRENYFKIYYRNNIIGKLIV